MVFYGAESVLSYYVGTQDPTLVVRLGGKHLRWLSHFTSPVSFFFFHLLVWFLFCFIFRAFPVTLIVEVSGRSLS